LEREYGIKNIIETIMAKYFFILNILNPITN